jgi:hypothetical protein
VGSGRLGLVFLSYKSENHALCQRIADQLIGLGIDVWADWLEIGKTPSWRQAVEQAIPTCDLFVPLVCARYFTSEDCRFEWKIASQVWNVRVAALLFDRAAMGLKRADSRPSDIAASSMQGRRGS